MEMFVALLFPMIAAAGFNQILELVSIIGAHNRIQANLLERRFERHLRQLWSWRWRLAFGSLAWLLMCGVTFFLGLFGGISPMVTLGGLFATLFVWLAGLTIVTEVSIYYRILRHNEETRSRPTSTMSWLAGLGVLARPFHALSSEAGAETKLIAKIELVYYYIMMIILCFTFWLGLFPDARIWVAILVILSGSILLAIISHLIGDPSTKRGLRFLKGLTVLWLILAIKFTLSAALLPNFTDFLRTQFFPKAGERINSWMMGWVTPTPKPPTTDAISSVLKATPPPDLNKALASLNTTGGNGPVSPSINTVDNGSSSPPKKGRKSHVDMDEDAREICQKFPDLENCELVKSVIGLETPAATSTEPITPPTASPPTAPNTNETLTPFGLPPVKQLP